MSCEVRKLPNFSKKPDVFFSFHLWFPFEMIIFVQCCPMFFYVFLWGGSIIMYHRRKSSPFQRWCCFQGQAVHGIPTGGCTLDPLTVRLFLREKKVRFRQDGAATCMVLVRTSDIYRNAKGTVDYIYDVFIHICMTPWHILLSRIFYSSFYEVVTLACLFQLKLAMKRWRCWWSSPCQGWSMLRIRIRFSISTWVSVLWACRWSSIRTWCLARRPVTRTP